MTQFLIVYDQTSGQVLDLREFDDADRESALSERFRLEREHQTDRGVGGESDENLEVVVLGADSRADLERTHARYFKTVSELASEH